MWSWSLVKNFVLSPSVLLKPELHCAISSTFTPHFMCWKCFDKTCMDKNLLRISLTKFNKLNKRRKHTFLTTQFKNKQREHKSLISDFKNSFCIAFALYLAFIFSTFSVYLWWVIWSTPVSVQFLGLKVKIMCCEFYVLSR